MTIKRTGETKLISCLECEIVFNTKHAVLESTPDEGLGKLRENLNKNNTEPNPREKETIYYIWIDLEQTEEEYLKYCPMCKKWERFEEVQI